MDKLSTQKGFTLVELITVIILVGIMAVVVYPRFSSPSIFQVNAARDDLISAIHFARLRAMSSEDGTAGNQVQLVVTANGFSTQQGTTTLNSGSGSYNAVTFSPATTLAFDKLGQTTATDFTVSGSGASASVTLVATGYAQ